MKQLVHTLITNRSLLLNEHDALVDENELFKLLSHFTDPGFYTVDCSVVISRLAAYGVAQLYGEYGSAACLSLSLTAREYGYIDLSGSFSDWAQNSAEEFLEDLFTVVDPLFLYIEECSSLRQLPFYAESHMLLNTYSNSLSFPIVIVSC